MRLMYEVDPYTILRPYKKGKRFFFCMCAKKLKGARKLRVYELQVDEILLK